MGDKYDKIAFELIDKHIAGPDAHTKYHDIIAAALRQVAADEREACAKLAESMRGGYSASIDEDILVPDRDGPWVLSTRVADAIRARS